jgi:hypothetical protein
MCISRGRLERRLIGRWKEDAIQERDSGKFSRARGVRKKGKGMEEGRKKGRKIKGI